MSLGYVVEPVLLGLSMGAFCLSYCFPFLATFITSENRSTRRNIALLLYFILGRFFGYMTFGLIFSYLGWKLQSVPLNLITDICLILVSVVLILHMTGLIKQKEAGCLAKAPRNSSALLMGFLMGINVCPPFVLSLNYVFSLHSVTRGVLYFFIFFMVSSVYFLPLIFVGLLARIRQLQQMARLSGILAAGIFIVYGFYSLFQHAH